MRHKYNSGGRRNPTATEDSLVELLAYFRYSVTSEAKGDALKHLTSCMEAKGVPGIAVLRRILHHSYASFRNKAEIVDFLKSLQPHSRTLSMMPQPRSVIDMNAKILLHLCFMRIQHFLPTDMSLDPTMKDIWDSWKSSQPLLAPGESQPLADGNIFSLTLVWAADCLSTAKGNELPFAAELAELRGHSPLHAAVAVVFCFLLPKAHLQKASAWAKLSVPAFGISSTELLGICCWVIMYSFLRYEKREQPPTHIDDIITVAKKTARRLATWSAQDLWILFARHFVVLHDQHPTAALSESNLPLLSYIDRSPRPATTAAYDNNTITGNENVPRNFRGEAAAPPTVMYSFHHRTTAPYDDDSGDDMDCDDDDDDDANESDIDVDGEDGVGHGDDDEFDANEEDEEDMPSDERSWSSGADSEISEPGQGEGAACIPPASSGLANEIDEPGGPEIYALEDTIGIPGHQHLPSTAKGALSASIQLRAASGVLAMRHMSVSGGERGAGAAVLSPVRRSDPDPEAGHSGSFLQIPKSPQPVLTASSPHSSAVRWSSAGDTFLGYEPDELLGIGSPQQHQQHHNHQPWSGPRGLRNLGPQGVLDKRQSPQPETQLFQPFVGPDAMPSGVFGNGGFAWTAS